MGEFDFNTPTQKAGRTEDNEMWGDGKDKGVRARDSVIGRARLGIGKGREGRGVARLMPGESEGTRLGANLEGGIVEESDGEASVDGSILTVEEGEEAGGEVAEEKKGRRSPVAKKAKAMGGAKEFRESITTRAAAGKGTIQQVEEWRVAKEKEKVGGGVIEEEEEGRGEEVGEEKKRKKKKKKKKKEEEEEGEEEGEVDDAFWDSRLGHRASEARKKYEEEGGRKSDLGKNFSY